MGGDPSGAVMPHLLPSWCGGFPDPLDGRYAARERESPVRHSTLCGASFLVLVAGVGCGRTELSTDSDAPTPPPPSSPVPLGCDAVAPYMVLFSLEEDIFAFRPEQGTTTLIGSLDCSAEISTFVVGRDLRLPGSTRPTSPGTTLAHARRTSTAMIWRRGRPTSSGPSRSSSWAPIARPVRRCAESGRAG